MNQSGWNPFVKVVPSSESVPLVTKLSAIIA
jgi:hypothetical protein